ncbi:MAG: permease prefix domain 2-containing transporter [Gammaproteobacteria bacterium]|nr:permease prefix domain 2-containing transporter [Gammaproteobacteria bacterium]
MKRKDSDFDLVRVLLSKSYEKLRSEGMVTITDEALKEIGFDKFESSNIERENLLTFLNGTITESDQGVAVRVTEAFPGTRRTARLLSTAGVKSARIPEIEHPRQDGIVRAHLPRRAEQLATLFFTKHLRENVLGDLEEEFETIIVPKFGVRFGRRWYWFQVVRSIWAVMGASLLKLGLIAWLGRVASWLLNKTSI